MRKAAFVLTLLGLTGFVDGAPARAQTPTCDAAASGTTACFVRKLCVCQNQAGGSMTGDLAGYRWNCDELRPACDLDQGGPTTNSQPTWQPDGLAVDIPWPREPHPLRSYVP